MEVDKSLLICVGVGGVFYHGMSRLTNFAHRRVNLDIFLIDPDKVEDKNKLRQWGGNTIGHDKVVAADNTLAYLLSLDYHIYPSTDKVEEHTHFIKMLENLPDYKYITVVHTPDNHLCRMTVHQNCIELHKKTGKRVIEITGGNTIDNGYAYSCIHHHGKIDGDWTDRHPDIAEEAAREVEQLAHPAPCGNMGTVEQSVSSNQLTAYCVWELAEKAITEDMFGEVCWSNIIHEHGTDVTIWDNIHTLVIE